MPSRPLESSGGQAPRPSTDERDSWRLFLVLSLQAEGPGPRVAEVVGPGDFFFFRGGKEASDRNVRVGSEVKVVHAQVHHVDVAGVRRRTEDAAVAHEDVAVVAPRKAARGHEDLVVEDREPRRRRYFEKPPDVVLVLIQRQA